MNITGNSWDPILQTQFMKEPAKVMKIQTYIKKDALTLCPKPTDIWNAFKLCPFEQVKVVIVGQDPYHDGSAHGLAFSSIQKITPSLKIIFKELKQEFHQVRTNPNLTDWAQQGVLLLNSSLTTVAGKAGAHTGIGWEQLTGHILSLLARRKSPTVFLLWGKEAKGIGDKYIYPKMTGNEHLILKAVHPMVDNYGDGTYTFCGCDHFRKANEFLGANKRGRIKWV